MNRTIIKVTLAICLTALAALFNIYLDEFPDILFSSVFTGLFQTRPGKIFNNYECLFIINNIVQRLQLLFKNINVYGWLIILINSYCTYRIILLWHHLTSSAFPKYWNYLIFISVTAFSLHDFIFIQFTKTAMFCSFLGCYYLLYSTKRTISALLFILFGLLLRTETFWLVFIFLSGIHLIIRDTGILQKINSRKFLWMAVLLSALLINVLNKKTYNDDDRRYEAFRTYKYSIIDFTQKNKQLTTLTKSDSVRLFALQNAFFGDTDSLLNKMTFRRLNIQMHERMDFRSFIGTIVHPENYERANKNIATLIRYNNATYFLWLSAVAALILFSVRTASYKTTGKMLSIILFLVSCIYLIAIYIKMENRVLAPLLMISLVFLFRVYQEAQPSQPGFKTSSLLIAAIIMFAQLYFMTECYYKFNHRKRLNRQCETFLDNWNKKNADKILVPDLFAWEVFFSNGTKNISNIKDIRLFSLDGGYLSMMGNHLDYMSDLVKSNHFKDYVTYLINNKDEVYLLGSESRMQMIEHYIRTIYGLPVYFVKSGKDAVIDEQGSSNHLELYLYTLQVGESGPAASR